MAQHLNIILIFYTKTNQAGSQPTNQPLDVKSVLQQQTRIEEVTEQGVLMIVIVLLSPTDKTWNCSANDT
jgi:hypothetical protein